MDIKFLLKALKAIGFSTGAYAAQYSLMRDFIDRSGEKSQTKTQPVLPGRLLSSEILSDGAIIHFESATLGIKFLISNLVSITWEPGTHPIPCTIAREKWDPVVIRVAHNEDSVTLFSDALKLVIGNHGSIHFCTPNDLVLRSERSPKRIGSIWQSTAQLRGDEHIYGMGERAAPLNLVGCYLRSWNTDPGGSYTTGKDPLYICTPVFLALGSTGVYLMYFENSNPATFDFQPLSTIEFSSGALRYYLAAGSLEEVLKGYTELTGRPPLPPRWALGYHQSRWGYQSESDVREIAKGFQDHQLPISAIHLDIDYMDGYRVFTIDHARFPDLRQLSDDFRSQGVNLVTIIDPAVKRDTGYPVYRDGLQEDVFCKTPSKKVLHGVVWPGWAAFPDFTNPRTRIWWGELYSHLLDKGISGFWHDMNEPAAFSAWGDTSLPHDTKHNLDGRTGNHLEAHNLYGLLMNKAGYEGIKKLRPDKRPWVFSRSGWAGLQRYAWNWTGDVASTWEALSQTLITIIGLSLSGHYFSGSDIGGFSGNPSAELYLRWFQMSSFHPFFRTHSAIGTERREPWVFGEPYTSIIKKYLSLRYRLIPYIYTLSAQSHQEGIPLILPIFWEYPEWAAAWDIDNQFLLGSDILIAPVLQPDCISRDVILPPGEWYLLWDDTCLKGPSTTKIQVSLERIPILIRAGSILPLDVNGALELHIFPGADFHASGRLYSDSGEGYDLWRVDQFECYRLNSDLKLTQLSTGDYPFPWLTTSIVLHGGSCAHTWLGKQEVEFRCASGLNL
jgi:alpha-glucosidase